MPVIISYERYSSQVEKFTQQYHSLKALHPNDVAFKKAGRVIRVLKNLYDKDKVYAVRQLNYLETHQHKFLQERKALFVAVLELLQKLILHKKLNKKQE